MLHGCFFGFDGIFFGLFSSGQFAGFFFHVELVDAALNARDGIAVVGEDFCGLGIAGESVNAPLMPLNELGEGLDGGPGLLLYFRLVLDGLQKLGVKLLLTLLGSGGRRGDGYCIGTPDGPGNDACKGGKREEDEAEDSHRIQFIARRKATRRLVESA